MNSYFSKLFFLMFFLVQTSNTQAMDDSIFPDQYPNLHYYQSLSLREINNYLSTLFVKGIINQDQKGSFILNILDETSNKKSIINIKIVRERAVNYLTESVHFELANAKSFDYTLKRFGFNLVETADIDLLTINLERIEDLNNSEYSLYFNQLQIRFEKQFVAPELEKSFIYIEQMDINICIETNIKAKAPFRNYIYFVKEMANPQVILSVKLTNNHNNLIFTHSLVGAEITPNKFFQRLDGALNVFSKFSKNSSTILTRLGFPTI